MSLGVKSRAADEQAAVHAGALTELGNDRRASLLELKRLHRWEWIDLIDSHADERESTRDVQRRRQRWLLEEIKAVGRELFPRRKSKASNRSGGTYELRRSISVARQVVSSRAERPRMGKGRVHKASNAESIVSHVLRSRGWTRQFRLEQLTGKQHLSLLEDCRQYGRQWMRHEAEQLFDRYGVEIDEQSVETLGREFLSGVPDHDRVQQGSQSLGRAVLGQGQAASTGRDEFAADDGPPRRTDEAGGVTDGLRRSLDCIARSEDAGNAKVGRDDPLRGVHGGDSATVVSRGIADRAKSATARFFRRSKQFIHELIIAGGMLLKGSRELSANEILALDRKAKVQAEYLERFEQDVVANPPKQIADLSSVTTTVGPPPMTPGQFIARAESYGNAPWQVQNIGRAEVLSQRVPVAAPKAPPGGTAATPGVTSPITATRPVFAKERRVHLLTLEEHRPCTTCLSQSKRGWQDPGTLLEIGDAECKGNCDCYFEWLDDKNKIFVSPWGRHNPHGHNQPGEPQSKLPGIAYPPDVPIPALPGGPGPTPKKKLKLKPLKPKLAPEPEPYEPGKLPTLKELLEQAGSPYPESEYEEA